jgi:mannan endo-1,4-beta-mannosidase
VLGRVKAIAVVFLAAVAGCSAAASSSPPPARPAQLAQAAVTGHAEPGPREIGVAVPGDKASLQPVERFAAETGTRMSWVSMYQGWDTDFPSAIVAAIDQYGALPLINLNSDNVPLAAIADGSQDKYLRPYAAAARASGSEVALSFDGEMNAPWWPWGYRQASAAEFVQAWRHVVTVFRDAGASNVAWVWTVTRTDSQTEALSQVWPGSAYVTYVGLHGYFFGPSSTFTSVFSPTISQISRLTGDQVFITETGANPASGRSRAIASLFAGARSAGIMGVIWFDFDKSAVHDWAIDDDPAALAAFRTAAEAYR